MPTENENMTIREFLVGKPPGIYTFTRTDGPSNMAVCGHKDCNKKATFIKVDLKENGFVVAAAYCQEHAPPE